MIHLLLAAALAAELPPGIEPLVAADERLEIVLVAAEPDLVTPTGLAVDAKGRVLVVESHTHFRPEGYDGPPADRIRLFEDTDDDGAADQISTFFEGTTATMNVGIHPDGSLFVATRSEVFRLRDTDDDGRADERTSLARLETAGDYPHNGLSGFAFDQQGNAYFGMGENLGADYRLVGTDGAALTGGGEGGNIYRMAADGSGLVRIATGFWNPFHVAFDLGGNLFAVDNDPDSRPPCRLLHIVPDGDYGYRFRNGRKGLHPFTAWNGELFGTLPMVAGTGEAPSGIVACDSDALPADYRGDLLITSWGDHRIERHRLAQQGASFKSMAEPIVTGGENFRPVGIGVGPDGSVYVSDWVDKSYDLHKKGRLWRIKARAGATEDASREAVRIESVDEGSLPRAEQLRTASGPQAIAVAWRACDDADPFIRRAALTGLKRNLSVEELRAAIVETPGARIARLLALRESGDPAAASEIPSLVADSDANLRFAAIQWIGEERLERYRPLVERTLSGGGATRQIFEACLASLELLDGKDRESDDEWSGEEYVVKLLFDPATPLEIRRRAIRMLRPDHPELTAERLRSLLDGDDPELRLEAVRSLRESPIPEREAWLAEIASDDGLPVSLRAEAVMGLSAATDESRIVLDRLADCDKAQLRAEAERSLRVSPLPPFDRPADLDGWFALLGDGGDPSVGERIFFHARGAVCFRCHEVDGRGGQVGPDLSTIGRTFDRRRLIESIVHPNKEIAPRFVPQLLVTKAGTIRTGLLLSIAATGEEIYSDERGDRFNILPTDLDERRPATSSIMPEKLVEAMTLDEFRDLVAYLMSLNEL